MKIDYSGEEIRFYNFNAGESYRIARKLEQESIALYESIIGKLPDNDVRDAVALLLEEERSHKQAIDEQLYRLCGDDDDVERVLDVIDSGVVTPLAQAEIEKALCSRTEALRLGVSLEKRAIHFYHAILDNTIDPEGRAAIENILSQEYEHKSRLNALIACGAQSCACK
jgi:rubrerythrin